MDPAGGLHPGLGRLFTVIRLVMKNGTRLRLTAAAKVVMLPACVFVVQVWGRRPAA